VTCTTVGGPSRSAYLGSPPPPGSMAIHPARPFVMPRVVGQPERFPGALGDPRGTLRPVAGSFRENWGEASTRSMIRRRFDAPYSVGRSVDTAVHSGASEECYLDHGSVSDSSLVNMSGVHFPRNHGVGPNGTLEAQQRNVHVAGPGIGLSGVCSLLFVLRYRALTHKEVKN